MNDYRNENTGENENREYYPDETENTYSEPVYGGTEETGELDFEKTQEMNSIQHTKPSDEEHFGITPRNEFTDLNSADDMSKTLLMDSVSDGDDEYYDEPLYAPNPVKKRTKKKSKINHTRTMGQVFLGAVLSVAALGIGIFLSIKVIGAMRDITGMSKASKEIDFEITEDMGVDEIIDGLYKNGIIEMPSLMKMFIGFTKNGDGFLNGPHTINSNMSYNNILNSLKTEKEYTKTIEVIIPEGLSVVEVGELLEENYVCRAVDFEAYVKSKHNEFDFEEELTNDPNRMFMLEGYLFPDTYEFYVVDYLEDHPNYDTSTWAKEAADKMMENFEDRITKKMKNRMKELGMTLDETIILASLIQREGTNEENMAGVSSVFHNRLNDLDTYPNLQSDTTYTYINNTIIPRTTASNSAQMQKIEDAYDTYKCTGLPVGAVCNPGLDAINAALYPADTEYYYFLAARDGTFYWAKTQAQHDQNVIDADLRWEDEQGDYE